jgi:D-alanyl-D-alanine carboxypeptidase/D-alanyl-D-alanine-endopeptidase (penicillin-binding protein 4)
VASIDSTAPIPSAAAVQALANTLEADPRVGESTGIRVVDIASGQVLADIEGGDPQTPASNVKLLTAAAIEYAIPPDWRLVTSVKWPGAVDDDHARLTLVAGGDMLLAAGYGHQGEEQSSNGYAGVADLADAVVAALDGTDVTTVDLVVDDHAFGGASIPSSWKWETVYAGDAAPVSGLAINIATIPGTEEEPEKYLDPSIQVGDVLKAGLEERGISVGTVTRGVADTGELELASVQSAPISDITAYMVWYSENTIAEVLLKILALDSGRPGTTEAGTDEVLSRLSGQGLDLTGITMVDGSGLSRDNRIPPRALTDLIVLLARDPGHDSFLAQLPIAALRGTLFDRFLSMEGAGVVRGKTGSLNGVTALSGTVVTADGRWLAYSIMADGMPYGQTKPKAAMEEFLSALAACGCG